MSKEIPINCGICKYCIEDYDTGELICSFDEENPNLLSLGECHEFKLGKIRLVEFLEEKVKKIKALEEWKKEAIGSNNIWMQNTREELDKNYKYSLMIFKRIEALESDNKLLKRIIKKKIEYAIEMSKNLEDPLFTSKYSGDNYRKKQKYWLKQLEGKQQMNKEEIKIIIKSLEHCRFCSNVNYPLGNNREVKEIINKLRKQLEEDE